MERIRSGLNAVLYPVQLLAALPAKATGFLHEAARTNTQLKDDYARLHQENLLLLAKLQRYEMLEADNARLRDLLGAAQHVANRALVAELLEVSPEPFTRKVVLAKGRRDGVYAGQPVIDATGIMGQITEVNEFTSRATLITDPSHAIPVQSLRTGLRAIVFGTGAQDSVEIPYLTSQADLQEGDEFITSGMGGIFPPGYPVARVTKIVNDPNESFLKVSAKPAASLNHSREVMLVWPVGLRKMTEATDKK
jgi:rod shape-determining protein MreC